MNLQQLLFLVILLSKFSLFAQQTQISEGSKLVQISGKIVNFEQRPDYTSVRIPIYPIVGSEQVFESKIATDGSFNLSFELFFQQEIHIDYYNYLRLIVKPGDSLYLEFDALAEDQSSLVSSLVMRANAETVQLNKEFQHYLLALEENLANYNEAEWDSVFMQPSPDVYLDYHIAINKYEMEFIANYIKLHHPSKALQNWIYSYQQANFINMLLSYPINCQIDKNVKPKMPARYDSLLAEIPIFSTETLISRSMNFLPNNYFGWNLLKKINQQYAKDSTQNYDSLMLVITQNNTAYNKILQEASIACIASDMLKNNQIERFEKIKPELLDLIKEDFLIEPLLLNYAEQKFHNEHQNIPKEATIYHIPDSVENPIDYIIDCYKGKVLCIDIWATWCGSCIVGMPAYTKLKEEMNNPDVEFVFLCTSSNQKAFETAISRCQLKGIHFFLNPNQEAKLVNYFQSKSILGSLLIDKQGRVLCNKSEFYPENPELKKKINILSKAQ